MTESYPPDPKPWRAIATAGHVIKGPTRFATKEAGYSNATMVFDPRKEYSASRDELISRLQSTQRKLANTDSRYRQAVEETEELEQKLERLTAGIVYLWDRRTSAGLRFLAFEEDVPKMRELLGGDAKIVDELIREEVALALEDAAVDVVDMVDNDPQPIDAWLRKRAKAVLKGEL